MIAKILIDAGKDPTVVVGSVVPEWRSNFREGRSDIFVVEA
jgi:UDP-N-acetylmuramate-alanine ligase